MQIFKKNSNPAFVFSSNIADQDHKLFQNSPVIMWHLLNLLRFEEDREILSDGAKNGFEQDGIQWIPVKGADPQMSSRILQTMFWYFELKLSCVSSHEVFH